MAVLLHGRLGFATQSDFRHTFYFQLPAPAPSAAKSPSSNESLWQLHQHQKRVTASHSASVSKTAPG
ncbi:hypothetical protein OFC38_29570, partial [Escherichia coli]|nr:hypothetical protein [Escherichia coli]